MRTQLSESRFTTQDGRIWPVDRARMLSPEQIRRRMIEDIRSFVHDGGEDAVVSLDCVRRKGWTDEQIDQHGRTAFNIFKAEAAAAEKVEQASHRRRKQDRPHRIAADAAAVLLIFGAISAWAGHLTGAI